MLTVFQHWHIRLPLIIGTLIALFCGKAGELPMYFPISLPSIDDPAIKVVSMLPTAMCQILKF